MRILIALVLTLAGLVAAAPSGSAAATLCSTQPDAGDLALGDDPVAEVTCTTEDVAYPCDVVVTVSWEGTVTRSVQCEPMIYCFTEPCPNPPSHEATISLPGLVDAYTPCTVDTSPGDDDGASARCVAYGFDCQVAVHAFGPWPGVRFVGPSCGSTPLFPPYDCVQDCDGPPDS